MEAVINSYQYEVIPNKQTKLLGLSRYNLYK